MATEEIKALTDDEPAHELLIANHEVNSLYLLNSICASTGADTMKPIRAV